VVRRYGAALAGGANVSSHLHETPGGAEELVVTVTPEIRAVRSIPSRVDLHGVPLTVEDVEAKNGDFPWAQLAAQGFAGKRGETAMVSTSDGVRCLVGLGAEDKITTHAWRHAGVAFARAAKKVKTASIAATSGDDAGSLALGLRLGSYEYNEFKSEKSSTKTTSIAVVGSTSKKAVADIDVGVAVGDAVCLARDFVNEPGGSLTPARFANEAKRVARQPGLSIKVLGLAEIKKAKLGGLLGVNRGSELPPRFVEMSWRSGKRGAPTVALVGKGITFDAGGLSIKSSAGMSTMKCDMGGAAAVIGAMSALPSVAPAVNVKAYVPMTDNMLGGDATRLGDVLKIRNGKTVEVMNTDAEGRLILADALSLATEAKPDAIIDLATLTGAAMVSLGRDYAALMTNNDAWGEQVADAAESTDEMVWRLPLPSRYRKLLDSPVADMKNIGGPYGGSITAALFLQEFVGADIPWVHLDIAGPAFTDSPTELSPKGGTGYGVMTLIEAIRSFEKPEANDT